MIAISEVFWKATRRAALISPSWEKQPCFVIPNAVAQAWVRDRREAI
jgi:hypothetical protein